MRVVQFVECEVETDFALLYAAQAGTPEPPTSMTFATSAPGAVAMTCGTKYANLHVRLERWDEHPPAPADEWEDIDELPWVTIPSGGTVTAAGFDPPKDDDGLVIDDLPRARVQVLAKGRHRYYYGDGDAEHLAPEQWLLRWWPDESASDAMAGPPRRLAGPPAFWYERSGWQAALHAWAQTGWHSKLITVGAFQEIELALARAGSPCTAEELQTYWGPWGTDRDQQGPHSLQTPVLGHPGRPDPPDWYINPQLELLAALASAANMPSIDTFGDALLALRRLDLLLVTSSQGRERYVPNPSPAPVWDVLDIAPKSRHGLITSALYSDYQVFQGDIEHLLRWAPNGRLDTSPLAIAIRLGVPVHIVTGTLRLLQHLGNTVIEATDEEVNAHSEISVVSQPH